MTGVSDPWAFVNRSPYAWTNALVHELKRFAFPVLNGPTLMAYSDYSGLDRQSRFWVMALLLIDLSASQAWNSQRSAVRNLFLPDGRRMAYKNLNDACRRRALVPFLQAADHVSGLCVSIAVNKRIAHLCSHKTMAEEARRRGVLTANWAPKSLESMMRIVQFVAFFFARVSTAGQSFYWISDEDECFAGPKAMDTKRMMESFSTAYCRHDLGELGLGTTSIDEIDRFDEDSAAVPDLVAGATAEAMSGLHAKYDGIPSISVIGPNMSTKSSIIIDWFLSELGQLKKLGIVFDTRREKDGTSRNRVGTWTIRSTRYSEETGELWTP